MKHSLIWRFVIIIGITLLAGWYAYMVPPLLGIDLAGGTSLVYELDMSKLGDSRENTTTLAGRVIDVLKKRIDPLNQKNMIWRVIGGKRIQIQMPYPNLSTQKANEEEKNAAEALEKSALKPGEIQALMSLKGEEREKALAAHAPPGSDLYKAVLKLAEATSELQTARAEEQKYELGQAPEEVRKRKYDAQKARDEAQNTLNSVNVNVNQLKKLIMAADEIDNKEAQEELAAYPDKHPIQKDKIVHLINAHRLFMKLSGGGVNDPAELQRLVTKAGVLDFRIAVRMPELGSADVLQDALQSLNQYGPDRQVDVAGTKARWFEINRKGLDNFAHDTFVTSRSAGLVYVLCYDDSARSLTHSDPTKKAWRVDAGNPYSDPQNGGLVLPFKLDNVGAKYMAKLTGDNKGRPMAILLDDRAFNAPNINSEISDSGIITFGRATASRSAESILKEATQLKEIMDAGSLPATLQPQPISVQQITPDMGADNITAGMQSAKYAVLAVMLFMCIYYTITGIFADLALMLNLVLVLAIMAFIPSTFTLPGIAGLVLTLGMAVDANVLINERIREEIHKGASLWMAIKQGYDKVFWTIFDANLTCSLTSIVLIYVGSEEVKGFGVTLLIGLMIHMFTALFVTRTLMMAAVKWGVLRAIDDHSISEYVKELCTFTWLRNGHWPFMRVITVSNIDWIGKRHIFWGISAVVTIAGMAAFFLREEDKYDIEFRGGTQVTFQLKADRQGRYWTREDVEKHIKGLATRPGLKELENARIYGVDQPEKHRFEMQTTIANNGMNQVQETLTPPLTKKFSDYLAPGASITFRSATQFTITLKPDATGRRLTLDDVRQRVDELAAQPELKDLKGARIAGIGNPEDRFEIQMVDSNINEVLLAPLAKEFAEVLDVTNKISVKNGELTDIAALREKGVVVPITSPSLNVDFEKAGVTDIPAYEVTDYVGGAAILLDGIDPPQSKAQLKERITNMRLSADFSDVPNREFDIIAISFADGPTSAPAAAAAARGTGATSPEAAKAVSEETRPLTRAVMVSVDRSRLYDETNENSAAAWQTRVAASEWQIVQAALQREVLFQGVTSFDAVVAGQAKVQAIVAIGLSLVLIVIYVWVRFGGIWYGIGAILSLAHDAIVALAATVLSGVAYKYLFGGHPFLLITDFKINLTMIAAYLTIIGYSVNDTIVIFDRVRELRGKSHAPLTKKLINDAINQCFGRTIWTTFTVFMVVLIMYIWGGEGVRGFSFAMLVGVITGAYSTLAIASPMLLTLGAGVGPGPNSGDKNPFLKKGPSPSGEYPVRRLKPVPDDAGEQT